MKAQIALFSETDDNNYTVERFKTEADNLGLELDHLRYSDINFFFKKGELRAWRENSKDKEITNYYDYFIFRCTKDKHGNNYKQTAEVIKRFAFDKGKRILNFTEESRNVFGNTPKVETYRILSQNKIPIIQSFIFPNVVCLKKSLPGFKFPLIIKKVNESHGRGIKLVRSEKDLLNFFEKHTKVYEFLIQEYIQSNSTNKEDIRIITIGKKVLGAYKKVAPRDSIITNIASGGNAVPIELTSDIITLGEQVAEAMKFEFMGIDAIYNQDGELLVLEVNRAPQFEGFEKVTGKNIPKEVLHHMLDSTPA